MKRRDIASEAQTKVWEAFRLCYKRDYQAGMRLYEDALSLYKRIDDHELQYDTLKLMGDTACEMEILNAARSYYEKARAVFKNRIPLEHERDILSCLKKISLKQRDFRHAYREIKQLLDLSQDRQNIDLLRELGEVTDQLGKPAISDGYFAQALALSDNQTMIDILKIWGQAMARRGEKHMACQLYRLAVLQVERSAELSLSGWYIYSTQEEGAARNWARVDEAHQELKAMGCDEC